jgi:hypothetical protein
MKLKWTRDRDGEGYTAYGSGSNYVIRGPTALLIDDSGTLTGVVTVESGWFLSVDDDAAERHRTLKEVKATAQKHEDEFCALLDDEMMEAARKDPLRLLLGL